MINCKIHIESDEFSKQLFGNLDENIKIIEERINVDVVLRDGSIVLMGEEKNVNLGKRLIKELEIMVEKGNELNNQNISYCINLLFDGSEEKMQELSDDVIAFTIKSKPIQAKTLGQKRYINLIKENTITFGIGPAGTGKTYLAVAMAARSLKKDEVNRIVLTRPAVEAGETLGFLPGDLKDKVDPYLRPLYDALFEILGSEKFDRYMERGIIEVAPLAFMRGRTLDNAFIILDEAQNTTPEQMKMFLTRLGYGSKAVVTGDITQTDIPSNKKSGLLHAKEVLQGVKGISICELTEKDVVRHELVQRIIKAYTKYEEKQEYKDSKNKNKN